MAMTKVGSEGISQAAPLPALGGARSDNSDALIDKEEQELIEWGLGLALTLVLLMLVVGAVLVQISPLLPTSIRNVKKLGEIGDFVGGLLNPVVALIALLALMRSIRIQRNELRDTRQTLDLQGRIQDRERAERTFFELLSLRANAVASIEWADQLGETRQGRGALKLILKEVTELGQEYDATDLQLDLDHWQVPVSLGSAAKPYVAVFAYRYSGVAHSSKLQYHDGYYGGLPAYEPELGHIFRATYQILKFIHRQPQFSASDKEDLANYLRAQMSEDDFLLFGLTALTAIGKKSRAAAIVLDFYQKRLQSIPWAKEMLPLFSRNNLDNVAFATSEGFRLSEV